MEIFLQQGALLWGGLAIGVAVVGAFLWLKPKKKMHHST